MEKSQIFDCHFDRLLLIESCFQFLRQSGYRLAKKILTSRFKYQISQISVENFSAPVALWSLS